MERTISHAAVVAALLLSLLVTACSDLFMDEAASMRAAREYLEKREVNAAAIELRNVLQANPGNAEARYLLAKINLEVGDFLTAVKEFRQTQAAGLVDADVAYGLARALLGAEDFQGVIDIDDYREDWPATVRASLLSMKALSLAALDNREQALATLAEAQAIDADALDVLKAGIQLSIADGRGDEALQQLQGALERYPDNAALLLLQADLIVEDDAEKSAAIYTRIVGMDSADIISSYGRMARLRLSQLMIIAGDFDAADEMLQPLQRRDRHDAFTNYLAGVVAFQRNDLQRAEELLLKVLKIAPDHNPTRLLFGTVNYAEKNYEQAAYFLDKYIDAVPGNLVARKLLARSYIMLDRNEEAGDLLSVALGAGTNDAELLALVATSELNRGRMAAGIATLEQAVRIEPGSIALRGELARAYLEAGETGLAIEELRSLLDSGGERRQTETLLILAHLRAGENSEAISLALEMVARSPGDTPVQTLAGNVFAASGDLQEARTYLERVVEREPEFIPAILSLASLEEQTGNLVAAGELYQRAVDAGQASVEPYLALARISELREDHQGLLGWLLRARQHDPSDPRAYSFLAEYHLRADEPGPARSYISEALTLFPDEPAFLVLSGRAYIGENSFRQALRPLQDAVKMKQAPVVARVLFGEVLLHLGRIEDARRELLVALEQAPGEVSALALLAKLEIGAGNAEQGLQYAGQVRQAWPELFLGYELAGDGHMASGRFRQAGEAYQQAWERMASAGLLIKRAEIARRIEDTDAAVGLLEDWLQSHPDDDLQVSQHLGTVLQESGRTVEAATVYERVIEADPENLVALNNLAGLYIEDNNPDAVQLAERAWRLAQDKPGVQDTYGWALVQNGQAGRGLPLLEEALQALPDIAEVRYHHAAALHMTGNMTRARKLLRQLLSDSQEFPGREQALRLVAE